MSSVLIPGRVGLRILGMRSCTAQIGSQIALLVAGAMTWMMLAIGTATAGPSSSARDGWSAAADRICKLAPSMKQMPAHATRLQAFAVVESQQRFVVFNYTRHKAISLPRSSADNRALTLEHETLVANAIVIRDIELHASVPMLLLDVRRDSQEAGLTAQAFRVIGASNCG